MSFHKALPQPVGWRVLIHEHMLSLLDLCLTADDSFSVLKVELGDFL